MTDVGDQVHVDTTRADIAGSPAYDPDLVTATSFADHHRYYGAPPFWSPGYVHPGYPCGMRY